MSSTWDPRTAYLEPSVRFEIGDLGFDTNGVYKTVAVGHGENMSQLALSEGIQFAKVRQVMDDGEVTLDRHRVVLSLDNTWYPSTQNVGRSLESSANYTYRVETEPYYVGLWYNRDLGFGWSIGFVGTSEWERDGSTMRIVVRYARNYITPDPVPDRNTSWLVQFNVIAGM